MAAQVPPASAPLVGAPRSKKPAASQLEFAGAQSVRKSNSEIGIQIKSGNLCLLARKLINILLSCAQQQRGKEDAEGKWWVDAAQATRHANSKSKNYDLLRVALDELQTVRVIRVICQDSCHGVHAANFSFVFSCRTGLRQTVPGRSQLRVGPRQRSGAAALASS